MAYYAALGVRIKRVLTDNGAAFRSKALRAACTQHGIVQKFTRAYRPQTNGKAERFIQSALRERAYGWYLPELSPTHTGAAQLATPLQLAPAAPWHRPPTSHEPTSLAEKQPLDTSQLAVIALHASMAAETADH